MDQQKPVEFTPTATAFIRLRSGDELRGKLTYLNGLAVFLRWQLTDLEGRRHTWRQGGWYRLVGISDLDVVEFDELG